MSVLTRILGFGDGEPIKRNERHLWADAQSLPDLCRLTAGWLEGHVQSQPGYYGSVDVDDAEGLLDALIGLNRRCFLTNNSQQGFDGTGYDGAHWTQHAAVTGFADRGMFQWLRRVVGSRFEVEADGPGVYVTLREGRGYTHYGNPLSRRDIEFSYDGCGEGALQAVCGALQVTVYDPEPGRNDLWGVLRRAASR